MCQLTPKDKAEYLLTVFCNSKQSAINVCEAMLPKCLNIKDINYYKETIQILKNTNMKNLILILTILTISFSCKKQTVEPTPEPEPIQTSKSFTVDIKFTSDSLCTLSSPIPGYYSSGVSGSVTYPHRIVISLDTIPYPAASINGLIVKGTSSVGFTGSFTYTLYNYTLTSNNMNKPLTYYINVEETLRKVSGGVAIYKYSKQYTFHEGDNGTINFNTLP